MRLLRAGRELWYEQGCHEEVVRGKLNDPDTAICANSCRFQRPRLNFIAKRRVERVIAGEALYDRRLERRVCQVAQ